MSFPNPGFQGQQQGGFGGQQAPQQPELATQTVEDFFASHSNGPFVPSFWFNAPGATVQGTVTDVKIQQKTAIKDGAPRFDKNGKPLMQAVVTLQTELRGWAGIDPQRVPTDDNQQPLPADADTGERRIYLWYTLRDAVTKAMAAAGVPAGKPLRVGDLLAVRCTGAMQNPHGGDPIKEYEANYKAGNPAADRFFQAAAPAATQAPAQNVTQTQGFQQAAPQQGFQAPAANPTPAADPFTQGQAAPGAAPFGGAGDPPF